MEPVTLTDAGTTVILRDVLRTDDVDPYAGGSFVVEFQADGLDVTRCVFAFGWDGLDSFLSEIADSYRGCEGTKGWTSPEGDLEVEAEADHRGHNTLRFTARDGAIPMWWATAIATVAAGEDMANLASSVKSFLAPLRST